MAEVRTQSAHAAMSLLCSSSSLIATRLNRKDSMWVTRLIWTGQVAVLKVGDDLGRSEWMI